MLPERINETPPKQLKKEEIDKQELSEYDKVRWDKLKKGPPAGAIKKGKETGVPQEELDKFAQDVIARETEKQNYSFVYRFRKNMGIGTDEEIRAVGEKAYQSFFDAEEFGNAMSIGENVYGRDSEEWRRANEGNETKWKKMKKREKLKEEKIESGEYDLKVILSKNATFVDLFIAIDAVEEEEGLGELGFEEELWDNFDKEIAEEVLSFRDEQVTKAMSTKVIDFFRERGYTQADVSAYLPIKFKREHKK